MIALIHAHPYPAHSRVNRALLDAVTDLSDLQVRDLYTLYPDFHIDVRAEQELLAASHTVVLQHPLHWYHVPALMSLWFEKVLAYGWAYGHAADGRPIQRLQGKRLLWATSTSGSRNAYQASGLHHGTIDEIATPLRLTAAFCGMQWLDPHVVHGASHLDDATLAQAALGYRERLQAEAGRAA